MIVAFDYAGIQARNVAMESKDKVLVKAFWERYDIHSDWRERITDHYPQWISPDKRMEVETRDKKYRDLAKNKFVFPSFFGAKHKSISANLRIPENIIKDVQTEFWDAFPDIHSWHKRIIKNYYRDGYVTGLSGVRRRAPISPNQLINAPIQADEALIVCNAMSNLSELEDPMLQPIMEIHDDLTFILPKKELDRYAEIIITEMLRIDFEWINVPLEVEMKVGEDWANLEEVGKYASDTWRGSRND